MVFYFILQQVIVYSWTQLQDLQQEYINSYSGLGEMKILSERYKDSG